MATLRAYQTLDIREVIRSGGRLVEVDADGIATGDQAFGFVGRAAFSERPGELRAGPGWLAGDADGDGSADFAIRLAWDVEVGAGDILL